MKPSHEKLRLLLTDYVGAAIEQAQLEASDGGLDRVFRITSHHTLVLKVDWQPSAVCGNPYLHVDLKYNASPMGDIVDEPEEMSE